MASETRVPSQAAPAADLPKCSDVGDPNGGNAFAGRSFGVPASVTLGADWTTYTATLTNASAKEMKSFELSGKVLSYVYNEGERDLSPYSDLQYWDTTQHDWKTLKDADGKARGTIPAPKTLKPSESVHVKLRFRVHKDLPMTMRTTRSPVSPTASSVAITARTARSTAMPAADSTPARAETRGEGCRGNGPTAAALRCTDREDC